MSALAGTLRVDGRPMGGQDILALAGTDVVASTVSDDLGRFALDAPGDATLIAKVRTGTYGVVTGHAADLDLGGPLHTLEIALESERELPARLDLTLDPVRLAGVPDELMPYTRLRAPGVMDGHFAAAVVDGAGTTVRVQPGEWRISASSVDPDRTHLPGLVADAVTLDVAGDCRVTLVLRTATPSEL